MFRHIIGRFACMTGKHERSVENVYRVRGAGNFRSVCAHCGVPMIRLGKGEWIAGGDPERQRTGIG